MQKGTTLFQLRVDQSGIFDGSNAGVAIPRATNVKVLPGAAGISLANGVVEIARHKDLDALGAFTIEAVINPSRIGPDRQNIIEGQSPAIAFFLSPEGKLVGSMHIGGAWLGLDSGSVVLAANAASPVIPARAFQGHTSWQISQPKTCLPTPSRNSSGIAPRSSIVRYEMHRRESSRHVPSPAGTNASVGQASMHRRQLPQRSAAGPPNSPSISSDTSSTPRKYHDPRSPGGPS